MWSLGAILSLGEQGLGHWQQMLHYAMSSLTGQDHARPEVESKHWYEYMCWFQSGKYDIPKWLSAESIHILNDMLQVDPKRRIPIRELLRHPWMLKGINHSVSWRSRFKVSLRSNTAAGMWLTLQMFEMWIQSSAVIMWSNLSWYYICHYGYRSRTCIRLWPHNWHPTLRPHGRAIGCLLWGFVTRYNGTALYHIID